MRSRNASDDRGGAAAAASAASAAAAAFCRRRPPRRSSSSSSWRSSSSPRPTINRSDRRGLPAVILRDVVARTASAGDPTVRVLDRIVVAASSGGSGAAAESPRGRGRSPRSSYVLFVPSSASSIITSRCLLLAAVVVHLLLAASLGRSDRASPVAAAFRCHRHRYRHRHRRRPPEAWAAARTAATTTTTTTTWGSTYASSSRRSPTSERRPSSWQRERQRWIGPPLLADLSSTSLSVEESGSSSSSFDATTTTTTRQTVLHAQPPPSRRTWGDPSRADGGSSQLPPPRRRQQHDPPPPSSSSSGPFSRRPGHPHGRPFPHRKRARLSSIVQSIEALLARPEAQQHQEKQRQYEECTSNGALLTGSMRALADAATPSQVFEAGSGIELCLFGDDDDDDSATRALAFVGSFPATVLDLVLRAAALTGLISLSARLWEVLVHESSSSSSSSSLADKERLGVDSAPSRSFADSVRISDMPIPSHSTQEVVCHAYRRAGRLSLLKHVARTLQEIARINHEAEEGGGGVRSCGPVMSTVAFNMILAAHCDPALPSSSSTYSPTAAQAAGLDEAYRLLRTGIKDSRSSWVDLDAVSFATVLQACARCGNATLAQRVWDDMTDYNSSSNNDVTPNVVAYNARLQLAVQQPAASPQSTRDAAALKVWRELIDAVQPDQYSIDWVIMPLLRAGKEAMLGIFLNHFVAENSQAVASLAFTAFLTTVVRSGDVTAARKLFDKYLRPSLSPVISGPVGTIRLVRPTTRHFNVLLTGYQTQHYQQERAREAAYQRRTPKVAAARAPTARTTPPDATATETEIRSHGQADAPSISPRDEAMTLYRLMRTTQDCQPNEITRTVVLSMCTSSDDIVEVVTDELDSQKDRTGRSQLRPSVLRAAIMAAGNAGKAGLAAWLYGAMVVPIDESNVRSWNVLVAAMAKFDSSSREHGEGCSPKIDLLACSEAYGQRLGCADGAGEVATDELLRIFHGKTVVDAFNAYLHTLTQSSQGSMQEKFSFPKPNSQTYCLIASVFQRSCPSADLALSLFRNATRAGDVPADGRFVNAVLRCFGEDLDRAVEAWKGEIRPATLAHDARTRSSSRKSLTAAYHGLLYVCGRAVAPQMALRIVYAMRRDGLDPDETALNCYHSGTQDQLHERQRLSADASRVPDVTDADLDNNVSRAGMALKRIKDTLLLKDRSWYESLLLVECTQYNLNDRRRMGEQRVRIIV